MHIDLRRIFKVG